MTTALIYARISPANKDKNAPKVPAQIADCEVLAKRSGYKVVGTFTDDNASGSKGQTRDGFEDLLLAVQAGKADVVLATEEERFARNVSDKERLSITCLAAGVTWHTIRDGQVNPADASGELMSTLRAAIGRMESRRKAERQVDANTRRRHEGERYKQGPRIFGWDDDKVTVNEPEAALIREGVRMVLAGSTVYQVLLMFRASGVKPMRTDAWQSVAVKNMLCRWSNAAVKFQGDAAIEDGATGKWEPIISRKDLEGVRAILARKGQPKNKPIYLATGIAKCACGTTMVGSGANFGPMYICRAQRMGTKDYTKQHSSITVRILDAEIIKRIIAVYVGSPENEADHSAGDELAVLHTALGKVEKQKAEVYRDKLAGDIDQGLWSQINAELTKQAADLDAQIQRLATRSAHDSMMVESRRKLLASVPGDFKWTAGDSPFLRRGAHHVIEDVEAAFFALDLEERRALVRDRLDVVIQPGRGVQRVAIVERSNVPAKFN